MIYSGSQSYFTILKVYYRYLVCLSLCYTFSFGIFAQEPNLDNSKNPSQYVLHSWSTDEGMASESTNDILQSDDGYIWIATFAGLHRFDGSNFTIFNLFNSDIRSPNVMQLEKDKAGNIWIGSHHGISTYVNGEFKVPVSLGATKDMSIVEMRITQFNDLWFSTRTNELYRYSNEKLDSFTSEFSLGESTVLSINETPDGSLFFGTDDSRLMQYTMEGKVNEIEIDPFVNGINTFYTTGKKVYIGTSQGLYLWDGAKTSKLDHFSNKSIQSLHVGDNGVIWAGTLNGLFRWNSTTARLDSLTEAHGMPNNIVRDMLFDKQGNLWVATRRNGIFQLTDGSIVSYTKEDGTETEIIASATQIGDEKYILANENATFNLIEKGKMSKWEPPIPLPSARLKHIFTDSKGKIWVSTYKGLYVLDGQNSKRYTIADGFPDNYMRVAFEDSKGIVWVGTKNAGLIRFSPQGNWDQLTKEEGLTSNYIMSIEETSDSSIVVGTISGLNVIQEGKVVNTATVEDGLPSNLIFSTFTTSNFIWLATNVGLTGYSQNTIVNFNQENGLGVNIVYDLKKDKEGKLWMPSEDVILSVDLELLEKAAMDSTTKILAQQFDESFGMKSSHCLGATHTFVDSRGILWIPTLEGIVKLDPASIVTPPFEPQLILEKIEAEDQNMDLTKPIIVPSGTDRLSIDFTAISYAHSERLQFRYRLDPFDEDWVESSSERNAIYTNLPPGDYEFLLQTGIDRRFTSEVVKKEITIEAAWWQTLWAKIFFVLLIIGIALLIYWLRLKALTRRNAKLESLVFERTQELQAQKEELNVAFDQLRKAQEQMVQSDKMASLGILSAGVAHEINNPLNFIQGGVDGLEQTLTKNKLLDHTEYERLLAAIKEGIKRAAKIVSSLNEFSHSTDDQDAPCNVHHMIENCLTMIQYRLKEGIEVIKEFDNEELMIMGNNGKIHQAFLNIVTNAIQAIDDQGHIKIKTSVEKDEIIISFSDSGQGIKPENLSKITEPFFSTKEPGKGTGLGLSITYSIIADHDGTLNYTSEWGKGTTATITLPKLNSNQISD